MSLMGHKAVLVRSEEAETFGLGGSTMRLLADASATGGALSTVRVTLARGADGATPHFHTGSSELFYVTEGELQVLVGEDVVTAHAGDLLVVPPHLPHAFAAPRSSGADLLIVIAPGVERFEYFRTLERLRRGEATVEELLASQERFDNHFLEAPTWRQAREAESSG
ncbi:cupin domain-containing protein [Kitasatospora sp. NPDC048365]|uniref:cupin domain-containing protein n=1 Tax=Kitasatospora sp. NPDC048365 TaxID=3364050 RepID=UPI00371886E3